VIVPGATPTTDPHDGRAVFRSDIAAPASSTTWVGQAGQAFAVSVFAVDASHTAWSAPAEALVRIPAPATHVALDNYRNRIFTAFWVLGAGTDEAFVCFRKGFAPATPSEADSCSAPGAYHAVFEPYGAGSPPDPPTSQDQFAVFARSSATGLLAPGASYTGEAPPPFPPTGLNGEAVTGSTIRLWWYGPNWGMDGYPIACT